jgi:hyperosmotically inducible protein
VPLFAALRGPGTACVREDEYTCTRRTAGAIQSGQRRVNQIWRQEREAALARRLLGEGAPNASARLSPLRVLEKGQQTICRRRSLFSGPFCHYSYGTSLANASAATCKEVGMLRKVAASLIVIPAGLLLTASLALASTDSADRKDLQLFKDVAKSVNRYTHFTIFDDVNAQVNDGVVTLTGKVTMPYKRDDIMKRVADVAGVVEVRDNIEVLPVSSFDDQLRYRIARAIYRNPNFWNYAIGPNPSIHIIVDHGHVTLTGVVNNDLDRKLARSLVTQFGVMSVTNDLKTDAEVKSSLEKS